MGLATIKERYEIKPSPLHVVIETKIGLFRQCLVAGPGGES